MERPSCKSTSVQRCEIAYKQGKVETTTRTSGSGTVTGTIHGPGGIAAVTGQQTNTQTSTTTQFAELAKRAALPDNPPLMTLGGVFRFGMFAALAWGLDFVLRGPSSQPTFAI